MAKEMPFEEEATEVEEITEAEEEVSGVDEALGEDLGEDLGDEMLEENRSLEEGVQSLLDNWQPTTPEGEQYHQDLQALLGGTEEDAMEEDMEYEEGGLAPKAFGFQIGMMGKEAAKRALGPKEA